MTAVRAYHRPRTWRDIPAAGTYLAGGADLVPLMRAGVIEADELIDLDGLVPAGVEIGPGGELVLGAAARMSDVAAHPPVHQGWPLVAEALLTSASPQVRNVATLGGNLLQRTRCGYFRDPAFPCNKRLPGTGCPAQEGDNRRHAVFGGSERCVAVHASDLAVALCALEARVVVRSTRGASRTIAIHDLYRLPGDEPERETSLRRGEVILAIEVPPMRGWRSGYVKVRDRAAFDFALVSAAVAARFEGEVIREVRVALGGVATVPWRLRAVEERLAGRRAKADEIRDALTGFERDAHPLSRNGFKIELARRVVVRALVGLACGR
jgi:xanthine dehydrogenase YagS FAD-binding subunit